MSSLGKEGIWETDAAPTKRDSCDNDKIFDNDKLSSENGSKFLPKYQSKRKSVCENVENFELATICKELYKLSLMGAAYGKSKQDVIGTMTEPLKQWLNGQRNAPDSSSATENEFDDLDAVDSSTSLEKNCIAPQRWLVRFFVNNHILKDATFVGCDGEGNGMWKINELKPRDGIEADIENAKFVFKEVLLWNNDEDWDTKVNDDTKVIQRDKSVDEILSMLKNIATNWSRSHYDGFICFFSSHGTESNILGSDGKLLSISEICASLNIIADPKLLFIQACQGSQKNPGIISTSVKEISEKNSPKDFLLSRMSVSAIEVEESDAISERLVAPMDHNLLVYYASTAQYESYRNSKYGSIIFIFLFYEIIKCHIDLKKDSDYIDIYDLLTKVNEDMKNFKAKNGTKQMPVFVNTLTKRVKLMTRKVQSSNEINLLVKKSKEIIPPDFYSEGFVE